MKVVPLTLALLLATFGAMSQPVITQQPTSQIIIGGTDASFSVKVSGVEPITYQWRFNDTNNLPLGMITTVAGSGIAINDFAGDDGPATNAAMSIPKGIAVDSSGNLFVLDYSNNRIRKVGTNGIITTVAGNGTNSFSGDGGPATNAALSSKQDGVTDVKGIAFDSFGNLFFPDGNRIRKIDTNGIITTVATLSNPNGVVVDANGNLFIADFRNSRIRKVDTNGIMSTFAGGGSNFTDGIAATNMNLQSVSCLALDTKGNVFVAGGGNIRKIDTNGIIKTITTNYYGNNILGLAMDGAGNLFFADSNYIGKINTNGVISNIAGGGPYNNFNDGGVATGACLYYPTSLAVDLNGNIFIADSGNKCIRKVKNGIITTFAGGWRNYPGDGDAAPNAGLSIPTGVAFDSSGNLYIADLGNHCIRKVNTNGMIETVVGNGRNSFSGDGGAAINASLCQPRGITFDNIGNLFISDDSNNRIRKVDANGIITTIAGNGDPSYYGDGQVATNAALNYPSDLAVDAGGNLFIADSFNNRIRKVATNGIITTFAGGGYLLGGYPPYPTNATLVNFSFYPYALEIDAKGTVFLGGGTSLKKVDTNGMLSSVSYSFPFSSFATIGSIALDSTGNMFVTDNGSNRICKINTNGQVTIIAGNGTNSFSGDGGEATKASLSYPNGIALDAFGDLFIADSGNDRIRKFTSRGLPSLIVGSCSQGQAGSYSVIVSNASGSVTSSVASLTVIPGIFTQQPTNQVVPLSSNASFNVVVAGPTAMNYQWVFYDSLTTAGATAQAPFGWVMSTTVTNGGSGYGTVPQVQFIGGGGSGAKGTAVVSNGVVVRVNMNNMGSGYSTPPTVQIAAPTGIRLVNQTNSLLTLFSVTATNAGNYYVLVTNSFSNMASSAARLTVTPAGYNQIGAQVFDNSTILLSFVGLAGLNYALDRSFTLSPADWIPQTTNPADVNGILIFTNTPDSTTNNFWRVRSVP